MKRSIQLRNKLYNLVKALYSPERNEYMRRADDESKPLSFKQAKQQYKEKIAAGRRTNEMFFFLFRFINNKEHISGIGPLNYGAGNLVTNDQATASNV